jgi:amidophosphoribosyltransferase
MATETELIAATRTVEEIRERLGATTLAYLSLDGLRDAIGQRASGFCRACLTREYPTSVPAALAKDRFEPAALSPG